MSAPLTPGENKILALPERPADDSPVVVVVESHDCEHYRTNIDADQRRLTCRNCKAVLDPYVWLDGWGKRARNEQWKADAMRKAAEALLTHAVGRDGRVTRCGITLGKRRFEVTVTNVIHNVRCKTCRKRIGYTGSWSRGEPTTLTDATGPPPDFEGAS